VIPTDSKTLRERLVEIADAVGAKPPGEAGVKAWFIALKDFPIEDVVDALDTWLRTKPKMPTPADIRLVLAVRLSDRIERNAVTEKAQFASAARRILTEAEKRIGRQHLAKALGVLKPTFDPELAAERAAIQGEGEPC